MGVEDEGDRNETELGAVYNIEAMGGSSLIFVSISHLVCYEMVFFPAGC